METPLQNNLYYYHVTTLGTFVLNYIHSISNNTCEKAREKKIRSSRKQLSKNKEYNYDGQHPSLTSLFLQWYTFYIISMVHKAVVCANYTKSTCIALRRSEDFALLGTTVKHSILQENSSFRRMLASQNLVAHQKSKKKKCLTV